MSGTEIWRSQLFELLFRGSHALVSFYYIVCILTIHHTIFDNFVDAFIEFLKLGFKHHVHFFIHFFMSAR